MVEARIAKELAVYRNLLPIWDRKDTQIPEYNHYILSTTMLFGIRLVYCAVTGSTVLTTVFFV